METTTPSSPRVSFGRPSVSPPSPRDSIVRDNMASARGGGRSGHARSSPGVGLPRVNQYVELYSAFWRGPIHLGGEAGKWNQFEPASLAAGISGIAGRGAAVARAARSAYLAGL